MIDTFEVPSPPPLTFITQPYEIDLSQLSPEISRAGKVDSNNSLLLVAPANFRWTHVFVKRSLAKHRPTTRLC